MSSFRKQRKSAADELIQEVFGEERVVVVRKKRRKHRSRLPWSRRGKVVFAVSLAVICIVACAVIVPAFVLPAIGEGNLRVSYSQEMDIDEQVEYNGALYRYNDNAVSVLFLGLDDESTYANVREGARCADVNLLLVFDTQSGSVKAIAFPRDTDVLVDVYNGGSYAGSAIMQLCLAYSVDAGSEDACALNSCTSVSRLTKNIPVNYYIALDRQAFEQITTDIGGVPVTALEALPRASYGEGDTVVLQGADAWKYCHYRDTSKPGSAHDRLQRQKQFVKAFAAKVKGSSIGDFVTLFNSVRANVATNLTVTEVSYLAKCYLSSSATSVDIVEADGEISTVQEGDGVFREHVALDENQLYEALLEAYYVKVG